MAITPSIAFEMDIERHVLFRAESKDYVVFGEDDVCQIVLEYALADKCRPSKFTGSGMA
jgi:hypothetical protein